MKAPGKIGFRIGAAALVAAGLAGCSSISDHRGYVIDPALTQRVKQQFAKVDTLLDSYRDPKEPGGFKRYTAEIKTADAAKLSRSIQALQEPLSKIAEKVATVGRS